MKTTIKYDPMRGFSLLGLVLVAAATTSGCSEKESPATNKADSSDSNALPSVYVVNYPLRYFAEQIGGPEVRVSFLAPADGDPAFWKPAPEQVAAYQTADLILLNGASYAKWVPKVSLPASRMVDTSASFADRYIDLEGEVTHSHGPEGEHQHGTVAFTTWLDMTLALEQARAVKDAFAKRWPEHKTRFEERFRRMEQDLRALDAAIEAIVAAVPDRLVVFSHPVYQYFERRYGAKGKSVHWEPDQMPDEAMWTDFEQFLSKHPTTWMLWEGEPDPKIVAKLKEFGVESVVVDPCGNVPDEGDFLSVMHQNVAALRKVYATK